MVQEEQSNGQRLQGAGPYAQRAVFLVDVKDAFLNVPQPGKVVVTAPQQLSG